MEETSTMEDVDCEDSQPLLGESQHPIEAECIILLQDPTSDQFSKMSDDEPDEIQPRRDSEELEDAGRAAEFRPGVDEKRRRRRCQNKESRSDASTPHGKVKHRKRSKKISPITKLGTCARNCLLSPLCFGEKVSGRACIDYNGKIGAFGILLALVAVAIVASFTTYTTPQTSTVSHSVNIVFMAGAMVVMCLAHRYSNLLVVWQPQASSSTDSKLSKVLRDYLVLIGIIIFYVLSLVLDIYHVVAECSCRDVWDECGPAVRAIYIVNIAYHVMRMIFMGAVTIFCLKFHDAKFRNMWAVSYVIVTILSANLSLWFESLMYEINERDRRAEADDMFNLCDNDLVKHSTVNHTVLCFNHTNEEFTRLKQNISPYFYPVTIEFSLLVGEWLFHNYFHRFSKKDETEGTRNLYKSTQSSYPQQRERDEPLGEQKAPAFPVVQFTAMLGMAINVLFCVLAFLDSDTLLLTFGSVYKNVFFGYSIFYYALMTLSIFVGFTVSRSKNFATINFSFDGLIAMVIFSAIGLFVQSLFRITATVQLIMCNFWNANNSCILPDYQNKSPPILPVEPALYLTVDLVNVLQVIFQISFVCYCQKVLKPTGEKDKGGRRAFNASLAHLAVCNLSCWLVDSLLVVTDFSPTDIFFGEALWKLLYNIVAPFTLFFRFNCMLFFAKAFLWNKDGPPAERMKRASWNILNRLRYRPHRTRRNI